MYCQSAGVSLFLIATLRRSVDCACPPEILDKHWIPQSKVNLHTLWQDRNTSKVDSVQRLNRSNDISVLISLAHLLWQIPGHDVTA